MDLIKQLCDQLLIDPFNEVLRAKYADALLAAKRFADAEVQLQLLITQNPQCDDYKTQLAKSQEGLINSTSATDTTPLSATPAPIKLSLASSQTLPERSNIVSINNTELTRFANIAGMHDVKKIIRRKIIDPFINPGIFERFKKKSGGGILLYGPPGCGKTMIAKAIATECKASFYAVGISDILNMFVGQSESQLASLFNRARQTKPSVLFFDELDALAYSRAKANSDYTRTLVNEFLNQLDGSTGNNEQLLILGATNMPWDVDDAMKRPGRFDRQLFVPPLDEEAKAELLKIKLIGIPCDHIDYLEVAKKCRYFSGADMDGLIEAAKDLAIDDAANGNHSRVLQQTDFLQAIEHITPTTLDWLKTAGNLVKFGNAGGTYKEVENYLRITKLY